VAIQHDVKRGRVEFFDESSHFPRFEEPEHYSRVITDFVLTNARK
jgi:hypothetical protein